MSRKLHLTTRKTHRYLGFFIGVQFLFWTVGGLYFSWNNMKDVHGKTLLDKTEHTFSFQYNAAIQEALKTIKQPIEKIEGIEVNNNRFLRVKTVNGFQLLKLDTQQITSQKKITEEEVITFVKSRLKTPIAIKEISLLNEKDISKTHEYRGKPLPVYAVSLAHETNTKVYVDPSLAKITSVRNDNWRRFDFLWMLHVMDFETRDHITNWVLRVFSVLGLFTIGSGFYLFYLSSPTIRKIKRRMKANS
ncbi:conserved protein of unknown function [Tenacibaculum sp. 190524A02b]|uniref:hypothetical protein n=1 Tax=Tenacibaculum vairaonense TaxID=3137860 RepID=UPI0032B278E6